MPRWPFTPALLDALPEELAELFRGLELELLTRICEQLKTGKMNEVTVSDIRALRSHGIDLDEIKKAIAETSKLSDEKLEKLFDDVVARNQAYYTAMIDLAQVTAPERLVDERDILAIRQQTQETCRNITQSMGFMVTRGGKQVLLPPAKAYQNALDSASLQIQSGAISYTQAITNAVRELADGGLKVVDYESGHHDHIDVAVRRAVMSATVKINAIYREQSMDYLETDLVETTAHLGARNIDGKNKWDNHEKWQGRWYRWAGKPRTSTGNYPDFGENCGYGSVTGIGGANCRHSFHPVIEGISEPVYDEKELEAMKSENRPKIKFEGKEYDTFQCTQFQRRIERTIRKLKRREVAFKAAGLEDEARAAISKRRILSRKYTEFSKAAGLPEQRERMKVVYA